MKQKFRKTSLNAKSVAHLNVINAIIEDYQAQGYKLTLRQLYYQLVSKNVIANNDQEYKKLSRVLTEGRVAGIVDWDSIEDRLRRPQNVYTVEDIKDALEDTVTQYRLNRQRDQNVFVEVLVEKDAISNVLKRVTEKYGVNILVNRGYGSVTAMYDAYSRYRSALKYKNIDKVVILYIGDHDPSGLDMIRDINARVTEMLDQDFDGVFEIKPIALTKKQIKQYNPPPNPAKITDSRSDGYIALHGASSWEVDALPPEVLDKILDDAICNEIDVEQYNKIVSLEAVEKNEIRKIINKFNDTESYDEDDE
ncbi:hypothetical protein [Flavobacterium phage FPSV-S1]|nr:hypothetical protein [Flavobacterium phage FPSV-S1]QCW20501.1 hypothetical protein [Flavobacterium phage FPSV-S8]